MFPHQGEVGAGRLDHLGGGATAPGQLLLGSQDPYPPATNASVSATRIIDFSPRSFEPSPPPSRLTSIRAADGVAR